MQVNPDQLVSQLRRRLAPVYFVHGDEPLLVREAADTIRAAATAAGFSERQVLTVESGFDWNSLSAATQNLSLFAERRLIELHMPTGKPGEAGAQQLVRYAAAPPPDTLLLVIAGKLEKATRESRWAKALDAAGAAVIVWPIETAQLPGWIARRMLARGLKPGAGVTELLAYHMEGNLLACDQEIEKLAMLWGTSAAVPATAPGVALPPASLPSPDAALPLPSRDGVMPREGRDGPERPPSLESSAAGAPRAVAVEEIEGALSDNARFSVFQLADATLKGEARVAMRMLESLRAEGMEPVLVLWALTREARALASLSVRVAAGESAEQALDAARVWSRRKPLVRQALKRLAPAAWLGVLQRAARVDRVIKGRATGDTWRELQNLALAMSGLKPLSA